MVVCAVICRKATFTIPDATFPSSRAQNRGFCALLPSRPPIFGHFEHKIAVFVRFWGPEPPFSGVSSTKSAFLCAFSLRDPRFQAFQAQNRHFCARGSMFRGVALVELLGSCSPGSAAPARGVLLGVWRGLFVGCKEGKELFSEGGGVFEEQCVHAGGDGTLYVGWLVVCEEAL